MARHDRLAASRPPPVVAVLLLALWLVAFAAGCREGEDQGRSGIPWECRCQLEADADSVEAIVCAMTAGEAAAIAQPCVGEALLAEVSFCDCVTTPIPFCELGECFVQ